MSRIGRKPISIPSGVTVTRIDGTVKVKGPRGELSLRLRPEVQLVVTGQELVVERLGDERDRTARAYHGMTRALIQNMLVGVTQGYQRKLEIEGVGYTAKVDQSAVILTLGYAQPVHHPFPADVKVTCPNQTTILVEGCDKRQVGQVAASIRKLKPPEPYKGKGIKYQGEVIRRKAGKAFGSA